MIPKKNFENTKLLKGIEKFEQTDKKNFHVFKFLFNLWKCFLEVYTHFEKTSVSVKYMC